MVTEKMIEAAQKAVNIRHGLTDEEMRRALEAALSTDAEPVGYIHDFRATLQSNWARDFSFSPLVENDYIRNIKPVYAAPPAPSVAVKALEWVKDAGKPDDLYVVAKSIVGPYRISPIGREGFHLRLFCADPFPIYGSMAEAKAAAQADYEARIRSALSAQVQDVAGWQPPQDCDGKEQLGFEAWASGERYDMHEHPLHYLFMDAKTYAARQGWKAALKYVRDQFAAAPAAKQVTP